MRSPADPHDRLLAVLVEAVASGSGWSWRGASGWIRSADCAPLPAWRAAECLAALCRKGLAIREDVRPPGKRLPVWLYRVTAPGAAAFAAGGRRAPAVPAPGPPEERVHRFLVPPGPLAALEVLARARRSSGDRPEKGSGWLTSTEIRRRATAALAPEDVHWLVGTGLAERRDLPIPARTRPVILYRATPEGLAARPIAAA